MGVIQETLGRAKAAWNNQCRFCGKHKEHSRSHSDMLQLKETHQAGGEVGRPGRQGRRVFARMCPARTIARERLRAVARGSQGRSSNPCSAPRGNIFLQRSRSSPFTQWPIANHMKCLAIGQRAVLP
jgi:hypothetical protein